MVHVRSSTSHKTVWKSTKHLGSSMRLLHEIRYTDKKIKRKAKVKAHVASGTAATFARKEKSWSFILKKDCGVTVVTSRVENPTGYGRIIRTENGISGIVEHKDCTPMQLAITEIKLRLLLVQDG